MLVDQFQRKIDYLRLSVTDRCDFRCQYCMSEDVEFMPKSKMLSIEEMYRLAQIFIDLGIRKIRLTGGEPLVKKNIESLIKNLGEETRLKELTLTTNGSQLDKKYKSLIDSGIKRINVSLDSLNVDNFHKITRGGNLHQVLSNLQLIKNYMQVKLNVVLMKGVNDHEIFKLVDYAILNNFNISFIEEMPLGEIGYGRDKTYMSSDEVLATLQQNYKLSTVTTNSGGPAKYWEIKGYDSQIGLISPHSHNFCESCNRIRVSANGFLYLCLGQENKINLIDPLRSSQSNESVKQLIVDSMKSKPKSHDFNINESHKIIRFMSHTGG